MLVLAIGRIDPDLQRIDRARPFCQQRLKPGDFRAQGIVIGAQAFNRLSQRFNLQEQLCILCAQPLILSRKAVDHLLQGLVCRFGRRQLGLKAFNQCDQARHLGLERRHFIGVALVGVSGVEAGLQVGDQGRQAVDFVLHGGLFRH